VAVSPTPLAAHVGHVLSLSAEGQMLWIAALRIVASMQNLHAVGYETVGQFPGQTMSRDMHMAIPASRLRPGPEMTTGVRIEDEARL
jgi:hypothetical protein